MERNELDRWASVGRWDVTHGLMPMATFHLGPEERQAYAVGYRSAPLGLAPNPYRDERRPGRTGQRNRRKATPTRPPR